MTALSRLLSRIALWFSAAGLTAMTLIICWQVFARYLLDASPAWAEQSALFLMLWFIMFAAAAGVREGFHIRIAILQENAPPRRKVVLGAACHIVVLLFGAAMAWFGMELVIKTWDHVIPTLAIPRGTSYFPLVGAGCLIVFFSIEHLIALFTGREVEPLWN